MFSFSKSIDHDDHDGVRFVVDANGDTDSDDCVCVVVFWGM